MSPGTALMGLVGLAATSIVPGCGWNAGLALPEGAASVAVEIFEPTPDVLERDLEPLLHNAMSRAISDLVHAPLVAPRKADLIVRGRLTEYRRRAGVRSTAGVLMESGIRISIEASLVRNGDGTILATASNALWSGFVTGDPDREAAARARALRHLAETTILDLFGGHDGASIPVLAPDQVVSVPTLNSLEPNHP